jgi:hypothetical protein
MGPAGPVRVGGAVFEAAVNQSDEGAAVVLGDQVDLDGGRSWRDLHVGTFPAVGEHQPAGRMDFNVTAANRVAVGVCPANRAARRRIERGAFGHPLAKKHRVN